MKNPKVGDRALIKETSGVEFRDLKFTVIDTKGKLVKLINRFHTLWTHKAYIVRLIPRKSPLSVSPLKAHAKALLRDSPYIKAVIEVAEARAAGKRLNLIEALKTGKPLRRPIAKHMGSSGDGWLGNVWVQHIILEGSGAYESLVYLGESCALDKTDLMAEDWEVKQDEK